VKSPSESTNTYTLVSSTGNLVVASDPLSGTCIISPVVSDHVSVTFQYLNRVSLLSGALLSSHWIVALLSPNDTKLISVAKLLVFPLLVLEITPSPILISDHVFADTDCF